MIHSSIRPKRRDLQIPSDAIFTPPKSTLHDLFRKVGQMSSSAVEYSYLWLFWLIWPFKCLILMILTMAKYHENLLKDSTLSFLFVDAVDIGWLLKRFHLAFLKWSWFPRQKKFTIESNDEVLSLSKFSWYLVTVKIIKIRHLKGHISQKHDLKITFMQK